MIAAQKSDKVVFFIFALAATGGLLFGYVIGVTSNIVRPETAEYPGGMLCPDAGVAPSPTPAGLNITIAPTPAAVLQACVEADANVVGLLKSINIIGALVATLICFVVSEKLGRRRQLMVGMSMYSAGAVLTYFLPPSLLFIGQGVYGLGAGFCMHAAPIYISETAPPTIRGMLVSAKEAVIVVGIVAGFGTGLAFQSTVQGWRYMALAPAFFAIPAFFLVYFLPPSPRWLYRSSKNETLLRSTLERIRLGYPVAEINQEVHSIVQSLREDSDGESALQNPLLAAESDLDAYARKTEVKRTWTQVLQPQYRRALMIGCGLVFLQQATGQPSVLYYQVDIFTAAGFDNAALNSLLVSVAKLIFTLLTVWRVDKYGRKPLLFVGITMMMFSLLLIGFAFHFQECNTPDVSIADCTTDINPDYKLILPGPWSTITLVSLMVYVGGYQIGFGPIAWLMISEIFPLNVRGAALSIAAITNFGTNILVSFTFTQLLDALTNAGAFWLYCALCFVSLLFVQFVVPETKGLTLEEIEKKLSGRSVKEGYSEI